MSLCNPVIDSYECNGCEACVELCPDVFRINEVTDKAETIHVQVEKSDALLEAVAYCPEKCIVLE